MLIFNTTFLVSDKVQNRWINWLYNEHIPAMLASGFFDAPQVAKVLSGEPSENETSFSVQFKVEGVEQLEQWHQQFASRFESDVKQQFSTEVLFFATVLQLMDLYGG